MTTTTTEPLPTACVDLDLVPDLGGDRLGDVKLAEGGAVALVRLHGEPLASLALEPGGSVTRVGLLRLLDARTRARVTAHLVADGIAAADLRTDEQTAAALEQVAGGACFNALPRTCALVSVVVCTLGQEPLLERCLERLTVQDHAETEIVVVDNDPSSGRVAEVVAALGHPRIRLVAEPRRGLSYARNAGILAARGEVVAFTDDDAVPDVDWVSGIAATFAESPAIDAVTGLVVPLELETPAQHWFEQFGSFDKGYRRWVWHVCESHHDFDAIGAHGNGGPAFPFAAGTVGSGNNMAFRRATLERIGGFDVALGAGTPSGGGEDLDAFVRVLVGGGVIVYEPRAVVRHRHRRELGDLESQARAYGSGLSAMLAKQVMTAPGRAVGVAVRVPAGLRRLLDPSSPKNARKSGAFPAYLTRAERLGFAEGPWLYARGRRAALGHRDAVSVAAGAGGLPPRTAVTVVDVETVVDGPVSALPGVDGHAAAWVVVRETGRPRAMVETDAADDVAGTVRTVLDGSVARPGASAAPTATVGTEVLAVSVVVPTIVARVEDLAACLDSLERLEHPRVEIVLVDNRPERPAGDPLPALVAGRPRVRVVHEPVKGISAARNAGVAAATGDVVAFTDDDVRVDPGWAGAVAARFAAHPGEQAVTGLILPAELETPAQMWFERYYGGFGGERTFTPLSYGVEGDRRRARDRSTVVARDESGARVRSFAVYGAGVCGAGANMSFRRSWLQSAGGFDTSLGTGTPSRGGEDLAALIAVLWGGGRIGYEPAAVVHHRHREGYGDLRTQMRGYGVGFTAMLTSLVVRDPSHVRGLAVQVPRAAVRTLASSAVRLTGRRPGDPGAESAPSYPAELARLELSGYPRGPFAYAASRRVARRRDR